MYIYIYTWKVTCRAALARTRDDEKWTDLHGQVGGTIRGTGQCCGPHASSGGSACLTLISLSVFSKKKKLYHMKYTFGGGKKCTQGGHAFAHLDRSFRYVPKDMFIRYKGKMKTSFAYQRALA